jgi:hypothetical protein
LAIESRIALCQFTIGVLVVRQRLSVGPSSVALMSAETLDPEPRRAPFGDRPVLSAARAAATALAGAQPDRLWALYEEEVGRALGHLEQVRAAAERLQVAVLAEATGRGLGTADGWGAIDWARAAAPGMTEGHAATLHTVARAGADHRLTDLAGAVADGVLPVAKAAQICRFHTEVKGLADPDQLAGITRTLLDATTGVTGLTGRQLGIAIPHAGRLLKPEKDLANEERVRRAHRALYKSAGPAGMTTYRLILDPEGAAILDAAIDPLARPHTHACDDPDCGCRNSNGSGRTGEGNDGGGDTLPAEPDLRSPAARRADALLMVIGRGVASPGQAPKTAKSQLVVIMTLESLREGVRGAGLTLGEELLSAATVRRLACDADLIPVVLGTKGQILDVGRRKRLVTPAIRLAAWLRDRHCTFPGCTIPAQWCDANHGTPWHHGVATSLGNTATLCPRHHTIVHERDLTCTIATTGVTWHR